MTDAGCGLRDGVIPSERSESRDLQFAVFRNADHTNDEGQRENSPSLFSMRLFFVYILANRSRGLYVGVTNDLTRRLAQHRAATEGHSARYRCVRLVYVETTRDARAAIAREKQLKSWRRDKKIALIRTINPTWKDLDRLG
jgi:putative endonuclease